MKDFHGFVPGGGWVKGVRLDGNRSLTVQDDAYNSIKSPWQAIEWPACSILAAAALSGWMAGFEWLRWMNLIFSRSPSGRPENRLMLSSINGCAIELMSRPGSSVALKKATQ